MKRPSLVYQAKNILSPLFEQGFGRSKHNDKNNGSGRDLIYSRNSYRNVLEKCCTFLKFCKEHFKVKLLSQVKPEYFTEFVKVNEYSKNTANAYKAAVVKLQNGYNSRNKESCSWVDESYKKAATAKLTKSRQQIPREIHDQIINRAYESKYENGLAFDLARSLGLRVTEITNLRMKDFRFYRNGKLKSVYIHCSKGGRHRTIYSRHLTDDQIQAVTKAFEYFRDKRKFNDRLFLNKSGSYQRAFERIRDSISGNYRHCGIHSMRKEFAKDYYLRELYKGCNVWAIKHVLTHILGHNRVDVLKHYLD